LEGKQKNLASYLKNKSQEIKSPLYLSGLLK